MKKTVFILSCALCCTIAAHAQLKVSSDGNVGIKLPSASDIPLSPLSVGEIGDSTSYVSITPDYAHLKGLHVLFSGGGTHYGIHSEGGAAAGTGIGVFGDCRVAINSYAYGYIPGNANGILGIAGGYSDGNYGVVGSLIATGNYGSCSGAGIVGVVDNQSVAISGKWAGYFDGNVKVTGTINGVTISSSDARFKKNIAELESRKSLNNVLLLKPVQYNLEQQYVDYKENGEERKHPVYAEKSQMFQKKHFGLIAQELKELYPDLVYEDDNGFLGVNYTGLIPVLVQSIQELHQEIETLKNQDFSDGTVTSAVHPAQSEPALYQNTPNPFSQSTQIKYYLPEMVKSASLCIYDFQGKQLKQIPVTQRGEGSQQISGSEFSAGIYLYALIADGKEIDIKRMILTE